MTFSVAYTCAGNGYTCAGNGTVEFHEFIVMMNNRPKRVDCEDELKEAFRIFDIDGNGSVNLWICVPTLHSCRLLKVS